MLLVSYSAELVVFCNGLFLNCKTDMEAVCRSI